MVILLFAHNEYDFNRLEVAFEVFRFENGKAVEHWDNIQDQQPLNPSGRGMLDGEKPSLTSIKPRPIEV